MAKKSVVPKGKKPPKRQTALATMEDEFEVPEALQEAADKYNKTMLSKNRANEKFRVAKDVLLESMEEEGVEAVRVLKEGGGDRILRHVVKHGIVVEEPKKKKTMTKTRAKLADALHLAEGIKRELDPVCTHAFIVGSVRRKKPIVGDIELLVVPKYELGLFDDPDAIVEPTRKNRAQSLLEKRLSAWFEAGGITERVLDGPKMKQFFVSGCQTPIELFITTRDRLPVQMAIRTGPADYSRSFVTPRAKAGLLRNGCRVDDGYLWCENRKVELESEMEFFNYVQGGWVEPEMRGM